jgi:DNA helicase IV
VDYEQELAAEQSYFDYARDVREAKRHGRVAPAAAASGKDASLITKERREHAMRMRPPSEAPAFGRIDLDGGDTYYIGYDSIIDPDTQEVLVVNWKTKIGELYSRAEATDPQGDAGRCQDDPSLADADHAGTAGGRPARPGSPGHG